MEESVRLMEHNSRTSLDLLKKATEAGCSMSLSEAQNKLRDLWETSLEALNQNAQAVTRTNARVVESWMDFMRRNAEATTNGGRMR